MRSLGDNGNVIMEGNAKIFEGSFFLMSATYFQMFQKTNKQKKTVETPGAGKGGEGESARVQARAAEAGFDDS